MMPNIVTLEVLIICHYRGVTVEEFNKSESWKNAYHFLKGHCLIEDYNDRSDTFTTSSRGSALIQILLNCQLPKKKIFWTDPSTNKIVSEEII